MEKGSSSSRFAPTPPIFSFQTLLQGSDFTSGSSIFGSPTNLFFLDSSSSSYFLEDAPPPAFPVVESPKPLLFGSDIVNPPKRELCQDEQSLPSHDLESQQLIPYLDHDLDFSTVGSFQKLLSSCLPLALLPCEDQPFISDPAGYRDYFTVGSPQKRLRSSSSPNSSSSGTNPELAVADPNRALAPSVYPRCTLARQRRKKLSDRTRALEKMMPWERKMDTATLLEEAHKYVKFLEAQVSALREMPALSGLPPAGLLPVEEGLAGLERLNRQQMLQVLVNSARVQEKLYSSGCCILSMEQTMVLKEMLRRMKPSG